MFSFKHATDKILSYKFGGDFNSSLEVFLAWKYLSSERQRKRSQIAAIQNHAEDVADEEFRYEISEKSRRAQW